MKTRILVLILAALMLCSCFVGCTGNDEPVTTTTQGTDEGETTDPIGDNVVYVDENGYEIDSLPSDLNFGGKKVTILAWSDYTMYEFESPDDTLTADPVNDALYNRNVTVETRLGIELDYVYSVGDSTHMSDFIKVVEADSVDKQYDYIASYSRVAPKLAVDGYLADINELNYIEMTKPWWPKSLVEQSTINDKLFFCSGDISTNLLWFMEATFYNKALIEQYNLDDPYELVKSMEWTMDKLFEMCENKGELGDDNKKSLDDIYGMTLYSNNLDDFSIAANLIPVKNNNGVLELTGDYESQKMSTLIEKWQAFLASDDIYCENSTKIRNIFFEERAIFMTDRVFVIAGKDNSTNTSKIEFEYGVIPNPMYNKKQGQYVTNMGYPFTMYSIPAYIEMGDQDMAAAVIECMASESYRQVSPNIFELVMKVKYAYGDEPAEMFDLIKNTVYFDVARIYMVDWVYRAFKDVVLSGGTMGWASEYNKNVDAVKKAIASINEAYGVEN